MQIYHCISQALFFLANSYHIFFFSFFFNNPSTLCKYISSYNCYASNCIKLMQHSCAKNNTTVYWISHRHNVSIYHQNSYVIQSFLLVKKKKKIKLSTTSATNINVLTQYNFFLNIINNNDIKISYILNSKLFHPFNFHNFQRSQQIKKDLPWNLRIFRPNVFFNTLRFTVNNLILSFDIGR